MSHQRFASRVHEIEPFRVVEILTRAKELEQQGKSVIHMEVGEPDFTVPEQINQAAIDAIKKGETRYGSALGLPPLREAIAQHYKQRFSIDISPNRIMVTAGASGALLLLAALLVDKGQGMLMADPGYPCNRHFVRLVEGESQLVPVTEQDDFQLTASNVPQYWKENTVGALVASPSNPTGTLLSKPELQKLAEFVVSKSGYLVIDEIYQGMVYNDSAYSALSLKEPELTENIFVINSFSKYFGMTGWRLGWLVAPEWAMEGLNKLAQNLFISVSTPNQYAGLAAFNTEIEKELQQRITVMRQRRDFLLPALKDLGFGVGATPEGAFYIYANIREVTDKSSEAFCLDLLEKHGVAITPGSDFGRNNEKDYVRFAYTTDVEKLREGVERIKTYLAGKG